MYRRVRDAIATTSTKIKRHDYSQTSRRSTGRRETRRSCYFGSSRVLRKYRRARPSPYKCNVAEVTGDMYLPRKINVRRTRPVIKIAKEKGRILNRNIAQLKGHPSCAHVDLSLGEVG